MNATLCLNCRHAADSHTDTVGCLVATSSTSYCTCTKFVQPNVTDGLAVGRTLRDEGAARAGDGAPGVLAADWRTKASEALFALATSGGVFSADDVVERAGMPPVPNMLGGLFLGARKANVIEAVGFAQSTRPAAHARMQRTWKGSL